MSSIRTRFCALLLGGGSTLTAELDADAEAVIKADLEATIEAELAAALEAYSASTFGLAVSADVAGQETSVGVSVTQNVGVSDRSAGPWYGPGPSDPGSVCQVAPRCWSAIG